MFITWTTYGTWLPGDHRGWKKWKSGERAPSTRLKDWSQARLAQNSVLLDSTQRKKIEDICQRHADFRKWKLHAVSARSNHVHIVVTANVDAKKVRDQFKAYATRGLRDPPNELIYGKIWSRGGDIQFLDDDNDLANVVEYVSEVQDRKDRDF